MIATLKAIATKHDNPAAGATWNYRELAWATVFGLFLQGIILPNLSITGVAGGIYCGWFDAFFITGVIFAYIRHETGNGWAFYALLMLSSAVWIWALVHLFLGDG